MNNACLREDRKRGLAVVLRGDGVSPLCLVVWRAGEKNPRLSD